MSKHTKLPWRVGRPGTVVADECVPEISGAADVEYYGGHLIAESVVPRNAEFIVRACNAHDDLLATVKSLTGPDPCETCSEAVACPEGVPCERRDRYLIGFKAMQKAKGTEEERDATA